MENGTKVEIRQIWAYGAPPAWFSGYTFIGFESIYTAFVKHERKNSMYNGMIVRMRIEDIRPEQPSKHGCNFN